MAQSVRELASNQCRGQCLIQLTSCPLTITLESFPTSGSHTNGIRVAFNYGWTRFIKRKAIQKKGSTGIRTQKLLRIGHGEANLPCTVRVTTLALCIRSSTSQLSTKKKKKNTKFIAVDETLIQSIYEYNLTYKCYNKKAD